MWCFDCCSWLFTYDTTVLVTDFSDVGHNKIKTKPACMQSKESSVLWKRAESYNGQKDKMRLNVCRTELQTIPLSPFIAQVRFTNGEAWVRFFFYSLWLTIWLLRFKINGILANKSCRYVNFPDFLVVSTVFSECYQKIK